MRIALAQMKNDGTIKENMHKSIELMREAAEKKADLILFPEVQLTEFFHQYENKDVTGYSLSAKSEEVYEFQKACKEYGIIAVPNIYLEENGKKYDASILIDADGQINGAQKMVHVAQAKQFYEQRHLWMQILSLFQR